MLGARSNHPHWLHRKSRPRNYGADVITDEGYVHMQGHGGEALQAEGVAPEEAAHAAL